MTKFLFLLFVICATHGEDFTMDITFQLDPAERAKIEAYLDPHKPKSCIGNAFISFIHFQFN
jgi:hypothetical protein